MKIINYSNRPVYADFTSRMVYRKKSFISKLIKKYHLKEVGIFCFTIFDLYIFTIICFACCQY